MPTQAFGVYAAEGTLGDQVSSTYEGRHVTLLASEINHGNVLTVVTKGYPVIFGTVAGNHGVGIALNTEVAGTDLIAIDTEGIWDVSVVATDDVAGSLVTGGDPLYINTTTAVVSKIRNLVTQIPFGYALGQVASGATAVIAVKVHWDPRQPQDEFAILTAQDNAMSLTVDDRSTGTGASRAFYSWFAKTAGAITAAGEVAGHGSDIQIAANTSHASAFKAYTCISGTPTIGDLQAFNCYCDNLGAAAAGVNGYQCVNLNIDNTNVASGSVQGNSFFRMYSHGAAATQYFVIPDLQGATFLFAWPTAIVTPVAANAAADNWTHRIACNVGGATLYLKLSTQ